MTHIRPRTFVVALVALASLSACSQSNDADGTDASRSTQAGGTDSTSQTPTAQSTNTDTAPLELTADAAATGRCAMPSAQTLATFDTAFSGTVTSVQDGVASVDVDQWYTGGTAATATVQAPSQALEDLLLAVDFEVGQTYLISASGDRVSLCGFTAAATPDLQALYDEAFAK